jgi:hypothetical protein
VSIKTESERIFEQYLDSQGLAWTRLQESDHKRPDYKLEHGRTTCFCEVKEFDDPLVKPVGGFSPCPAIREKITQARKQFRGCREHCCVLVLWNGKSIYRSTMLDVVASAAFGKSVETPTGHGSKLQAGPSGYRFSGRAELTSEHNTTVSAIASLGPYRLNHLWLEMWRILERKEQEGEEITPWLQFEVLEQLSCEREASFSYEGTIRTIVLENPYARIPFPSDLFVGPFDQRWSLASGSLSPVFLGAELRHLKGTGVPSVFL